MLDEWFVSQKFSISVLAATKAFLLRCYSLALDLIFKDGLFGTEVSKGQLCNSTKYWSGKENLIWEPNNFLFQAASENLSVFCMLIAWSILLPLPGSGGLDRYSGVITGTDWNSGQWQIVFDLLLFCDT